MRREFPAKVKLAAWDRCQRDGKPHCEGCGLRIVGVPEYDHIKPDGLGGEPTLENCAVLCGKCHRIKTHEEDRPVMAKADRQMKAHAGVKRTSRPMPGSRASRWKRTLDGRTVER
jgi:5-methylcytosine-specific restriction endonuclease McrA